ISLVGSVLLRRLRVRLRLLSLFQRRLTAALGVVAQCLHAFRDQHRPTPRRNRKKLSAGYWGTHPVLAGCAEDMDSRNKSGHDGGETASNAAKPLSLQRSRLCARLWPLVHHFFQIFGNEVRPYPLPAKVCRKADLALSKDTPEYRGRPGGPEREREQQGEEKAMARDSAEFAQQTGERAMQAATFGLTWAREFTEENFTQ